MHYKRFGALLVGAVFASGCAVGADGVVDSEMEEFLREQQSEIYNGDVVQGAGPDGRWKGIVRLASAGCSGFFITGRHILTAAHCFSGNGSREIKYDAPGLARRTVTATITRNPCYRDGGRSCDQAIVTLPSNDPWATSSNRFWLYGGPTIKGTWLHAYGYGYSNYDGSGLGTLRTAPNHASFAITSHTDGYFEGEAYGTRTCEGDSGGPVMVESSNPATRPIVWGTVDSGLTNRTHCTGRGDTMIFAKTATNIGFYESVIGRRCVTLAGNPPGSPLQCW